MMFDETGISTEQLKKKNGKLIIKNMRTFFRSIKHQISVYLAFFKIAKIVKLFKTTFVITCPMLMVACFVNHPQEVVLHCTQHTKI